MTICTYCNWRDLTNDEYGFVDYCTKKRIYSEQMIDIEECEYFIKREKGTLPFTIKLMS